MQRLIEGAHKFRNDEFGNYRKLFRKLSQEGQNPHTLFITCSDSRVLAELITQSKPGDLFVIKNIGNIIPPANIDTGFNSTGAGIEFAVDVLGVTDIVVCGHSQCGAIAALMNPQAASEDVKHLHKWITLANPVRETIERNYSHLTTDAERIRAAEEENVLFSIDQLHSYPAVEKKLQEGALRLHAWFFKIDSAELFGYDPENRQFQLITDHTNNAPNASQPNPQLPLRW